MKIEIDIPDELYNVISNDTSGVHEGRVYDIIRKGKPAPKTNAINLLVKWHDICQEYVQCGLCPLQGLCMATPDNFKNISLLVRMIEEVYDELQKE